MIKYEQLANKIVFWGVRASMLIPAFISPFLLLPDKFAKAVIFRGIIELILIAYLYLAINKKKYRPKLNALTISVATFWFVGLLATIFSAQPFTSLWGSATRGSGFFNFSHYVAFFFILIGTVKTKEQWKQLFDFAIIVAVFVSFFGVLQRLFPGLNADYMNSEQDRPASTMGNPIMLANYLVMLIIPTFAFWYMEPRGRKKILYILAGSLMLVALFLTKTKGSLIGLAGGGFFLILFYPFAKIKITQNKKYFILLGIMLLLFLIFIFNNSLHLIPERLTTVTNLNRLTSWQIAIEATLEKPLLGWGPENFAVPFDKYYPGGYTKSYTSLGETWWDRAHNVPLEISATMGIAGLIAYLTIFGALLIHLRKAKKQGHLLMSYVLGAVFVAYFAQNLTSFDSVVSYVLFFTLAAYVMFLSSEDEEEEINSNETYDDASLKKITFIGVSAILLYVFFQLTLTPFLLNYRTNKDVVFAREGNYAEAIKAYRTVISENQGRTHYEKELNEKFMKIAFHFAPSVLNQLKDREEYIRLNEETATLLVRSAEFEPLHTKHYYNLGLLFSNISTIKTEAALEAIKYFQKANELSPNREQVLVEYSKALMIVNNYEQAIKELQKVIAINPELAEAYFWTGIANLYNKNVSQGKLYLDFAKRKGRKMQDTMTLNLLAGVYSDIQAWEETLPFYHKLIERNPNDIDTRALLAGTYQKLGRKAEARAEAEKLLEIAPEAKDSIEAFLKSL